jgi:hypothetical protein
MATAVMAVFFFVLSYIWIPFSVVGIESDWIFLVVGGSEVLAITLAILAIISGIRIESVAATDLTLSRRARWAKRMGITVCAAVILFNLAGILLF